MRVEKCMNICWGARSQSFIVLVGGGVMGILLAIEISYNNEALHFVKQWVPYICVIEPLALRQKLHPHY